MTFQNPLTAPQLPPPHERNLGAVMARALKDHPDKLAVRDPERALSYRALNEEALRLAGGFAALGVARQDRVLVMLDNHLDFVACWIGLGLAARVEVPVNTAYLGAILTHVVNNCGAKVMVAEGHYLDRIAAVADQLTTLETIVVRGPAPRVDLPARIALRPYSELAGAPAAPEKIDPWDLVGIMFTSGTTGLSKGVRVTHAHAYGYATPAVYGACSHDDVVHVSLPLFHIGGQWAGVYNALIAGASAVVTPRFAATKFWDEVREYGCTYTLLLGVMAEFLYRQPPDARDADQPMRRCVMVPVIPALDDFKKRFGMHTVSTAYGSTEASAVILSPVGGAEPGKVGWLRPDFEARLVDDHDMDVPQGTAGELIVRAREPWLIMDGYHDMPQATVDAWRNLWFHTGDQMVQDARGMYTFVDRVKDAIRRRGENVSSFEVEREIGAHPAVRECAVVAVRSDATEDDIKACIVLDTGARLTGEELVAFLKPRLPYFMIPRYVQFLPELPKTPTEKIRKQPLRDLAVTSETWDAAKAGVSLR